MKPTINQTQIALYNTKDVVAKYALKALLQTLESEKRLRNEDRFYEKRDAFRVQDESFKIHLSFVDWDRYIIENSNYLIEDNDEIDKCFLLHAFEEEYIISEPDTLFYSICVSNTWNVEDAIRSIGFGFEPIFYTTEGNCELVSDHMDEILMQLCNGYHCETNDGY